LRVGGRKEEESSACKKSVEKYVPIALDVLQEPIREVLELGDIHSAKLDMLLDLMPGLDWSHFVALLRQLHGPLQEVRKNRAGGIEALYRRWGMRVIICALWQRQCSEAFIRYRPRAVGDA